MKVEAFQGDKSLGKAEERFLVREPKQLELQNPVPDLPTMQRIAQETGGLVASPGFNTDSETAVPGAKAFPAPASGLTIIETRRPFAGAGTDARRSTSASRDV